MRFNESEVFDCIWHFLSYDSLMLLELLEMSCRELQYYRQHRPLECILLNCLQASPDFSLFLMLPEILDFFFSLGASMLWIIQTSGAILANWPSGKLELLTFSNASRPSRYFCRDLRCHRWYQFLEWFLLIHIWASPNFSLSLMLLHLSNISCRDLRCHRWYQLLERFC